MSLATFTDLQASVAKWAHRGDLAPMMADFVALAEERIGKDLRLNAQITTGTVTTDADGFASLPADWLEFAERGVRFDGESIDYAPINDLSIYETGPYQRYSIQGTKLMLAPVSGTLDSIDITYYARFPALSDGTPTNWLLTNHPSVYLNACLIEAAIYADDVEAAGRWGALYNKAAELLKSTDKAALYNGARLRMRGR